MVQEQMSNIIKHAQAKHVNIELRREPTTILMRIQDDGVGFDINQQRKGIGIYNIISRSDLYNGIVDIQTSPGAGCSITITFPIKVDILM